MDVKEYVGSSGQDNCDNGNCGGDDYGDGDDDDDDVYSLLTKLSRHLLHAHRSFPQTNVRSVYDDDFKRIKRLRVKAYEILLQKSVKSVPDRENHELREADPLVEIQKHAFVLKLKSKHSYNATVLEHLLQKLEDFPCKDPSVLSVLKLLLQLKSFDLKPEPIMNIFYCGRTNPAVPQIMRSANRVPPFQIYPMECFLSSDKFEATLETQWFQISNAGSTNIRREINFLHDSIRSKTMLEIDCTDVSVARGFISNHAFDKVSSRTLLHSCQRFTVNSDIDLRIFQNNMLADECENMHVYPSERVVATNSLCLPLVHTNIDEDESVTNTRKSFEQSGTDESNSVVGIWNCAWSQTDFVNATTNLEHRTWEHFGEMQSARESMFITESSVAGIHLEKIIETNNLPLLLSEKILNSAPCLKEISSKVFIHDLRSMLLGVESDSFEYRYMTGFALRRNIGVNGLSRKSLEQTCQEAINWGNCFRFLTHLVTSKLPDTNGKLPQEGLIFKAMCTNIKELLLYYQAILVRIFTHENQSERLLRTFKRVRSVATLITKVAKICEPYRGSRCMLREGSSILTRIYNAAIKVTDTKVALVFYSLLKSCCDVYFRFLQKWIFEGICDDVYGEFMIKTRPQYLRNRSHKFWTKSFGICNDAVPGFLSDIADSILQCGKAVTLLRTCDSKNPVCHICITEQPEIQVCLSVMSLDAQSSRCREYERKGEAALGSVLSLSTAILSQKQLEKEKSDVVVNTERDTTVWRTRGEQGGRVGIVGVATKVSTESKRNNLANSEEQCPASDLEETSKEESGLSSRMYLQIEHETEQNGTKIESRCSERAKILDYYKHLANDINKRRIRSQWRVRRMKFYDKRIDALSATKQGSRDQQMGTSKETNCTILSVPPIETSTSIADENKNYTEAPYRTLTSDTVTVSCIEPDQDKSTHDRSSGRNNNENYDLRCFQGLDAISTRTQKMEFSTNEESTNDRLNEILKSLPIHWTDRSSAIERPTSLNVIKMDNTTEQTQIGDARMQSAECNMTPNNNQYSNMDTGEIELADITTKEETGTVTGTGTALPDRVESATSLNRACNLATPMSCTTDDNFSSSVASPVSQTYTSADLSPAETATPLVPSCSRATSRSSVPVIKKDLTFSDSFELVRDEANSNGPLSITDVEIIDHISLHAYLEKSIRIPLRVQSRLINNAVIKYFLKENNLLLHLHSLRSYFFLLNGEFAKSLTDSLYARLYEISVPVELFNSATLTNLLERALVNSFNNVYVNSELLSLSATDTPAELHISDPAALDCLSLNYKINWPLNIILDETVMQQYGKVFKFLVTSGRVSWVLQEDFNIMKRERNAIASGQYHKLQLYRHAMTQFMNALHNYLTCSVLHASWAEFEKDLENSATVDHIYLSHINYIKRILSRCMLNSRGEKVRVCLNNIFKVILKFHNRIRSQSWVMKSTGYMAHPNFKKLEQMYRAFCELRAYMAHVAFKLATSGYQPHLMHFLNALNINQEYDLTVKTCRGSVGPHPESR